MKRFAWMIVMALVAGGAGRGLADDLRSPEFYQFAQKSAELYRGQLFSRPEIEIFVREIGQESKAANPILSAFLATPYDVVQTAELLRWLDDQCRKKSCDKMQAFEDRLELHYNQLRQIADVYEG